MFEYFSTVLLFPQSFMFTLLLFGVIGILLLFVVLLHAFSKQEKIMHRPALWDGLIRRIFFAMNKFILMPYNSHSKLLFEFFHALKMYKTHATKYDLPFCLMIGRNDLTVNIAQKIDMSFGAGVFISEDEKYVIYGYQKGVLIRCSEEAIKTEDYIHFIELLSNHKSAIPLDSVNIVLSAEEILHNNQEQDFLITKEWAKIMQNLYKITASIMPINMIIGDLEKLPGFDNFVEQLTDEQRNEFLGWSREFSTMGLDTESIYNALFDRMMLIQQVVLTRTQNVIVAEDCITFTNAYTTLIQKLTNIIKHLSVFMEKSCLNGVYFVGDKQSFLCFNNNLWDNKIFLQQGMIEYLYKYSFYKNYALRALQILVCVSGVVGMYFMFHNHKLLRHQHSVMMPKWIQLEGIVNKQTRAKLTNYDEVEAIYLFMQYNRLLNHDELLYKTIPTSYISDVWYVNEDALMHICQFVILDKVATKLDKQIASLVRKVDNIPSDLIVGENIADSKIYKNFAYLVNKLALYIKLSNKMASLHYQDSLDDLDYLLRNLYKMSFGNVVLESNVYLQTMRRANIKAINWSKYESTLKKLFINKLDLLLKEKLNSKYIAKKIRSLEQQLENLTDKSVDLYELKYSLMLVLNWIDTEVDDMFSYDTFKIGNKWIDFLSNLELLGNVIGRSTIDDSYSKLEEAFKSMKATLLSIKLPSIGFIIQQESDGKLNPAKDLLKLLGLLNTLVVERIVSIDEKKTPDVEGESEFESVKQKLLNQLPDNKDQNESNTEEILPKLHHKNKKTKKANKKVFFSVKQKNGNKVDKKVNYTHTNKFFFKFDINLLADINKRIEQFLLLAKENEIGQKNSIFSNALMILSEEVEKLLLIPDSKAMHIKSLKYNNKESIIQASMGYISKILVFAKNNDSRLFKLLVQSLLNTCLLATEDAYNTFLNSGLFELDVNILIGGYDAGMIQKFYSNQVKKLSIIMQTVPQWTEIYRLLQQISSGEMQGKSLYNSDLKEIEEEQLEILGYIVKTLKDYNTTSGDIIALQSSVIKVFADPDPAVASDKEQWSGKNGFFADKFTHAMKVAKNLMLAKKGNVFIEDYAILATFFNNKCADKFPFNVESESNVSMTDITELYKEVDKLLKKFDIKWLEENNNQSINVQVKNVLDLIYVRDALETYAKDESDYQLNIDMRAKPESDEYVEELSQFILEVDNQQIDFRSKNLILPWKGYEKIALRMKLTDDSEYVFKNDQKEDVLIINDSWGLWRFKEKFTKGDYVVIRVPLKKENGEESVLKCYISLKIMNKKQEVIWKRLPNKL